MGGQDGHGTAFHGPPAASPLKGRSQAPRPTARIRGWLMLLALAGGDPATADRVDLDDGRSLTGRFALLPGVSVDADAKRSLVNRLRGDLSF